MDAIGHNPLKSFRIVLLYFLLLTSPDTLASHSGEYHWYHILTQQQFDTFNECANDVCRDLPSNCSCTVSEINPTSHPNLPPGIAVTFIRTFRPQHEPGTNPPCTNSMITGCRAIYSSIGNCTLNKQWQPDGELQIETSGGSGCGVTVKVPQKERPCQEKSGASKVGNPINCASGIKTQTEVDYRSLGPYPLIVQRHYSSFQFDPAGSASPSSVQDLRLQENEFAIRFKYRSNLQLAEIFWPDGGHYAFNLANTNGAVGYSDRDSKGYVQKVDAFTYDYFDMGGKKYRFDNTGRLTSITEPNGFSRTLTYYPWSGAFIQSITDSFNRTLTYSYDTSAKLISIQLPDGSLIRYTYDSKNRLDSVIYPDETPSDDNDNPRRFYHYENSTFPNSLTGITDENGIRFATWTYDSQGRATSSEHAGGAEKVSLNYTSATETEVRFYRTSSDYRQSVYTHEKLNGQEVITEIETSPCSNCTVGTEVRQYDSNGYLQSLTDVNGNVTQYMHNTRGLETSRTEAYGTPLAHTITTDWHATFDLPTLITESGRTITFTYDTSGNMLTRTETDTTVNPNVTRTTTYTYNSFGQALTVDGPRTDVTDFTTYAYGSSGNLISITNALNQQTQFTSYDAHGNPLTIVDPNGVTTTLTYDARQRLLTRTVAAGTASAATTSFEYYPTGKLKKIIQPDSSFLLYTYDNAQRLIKVEDNLGNHISYTLDAAGNRTEEKLYDPSDVLVKTQTSVFNNLSRLIETVSGANQSTEYAHDANGNLTGITDPSNNTTTNTFDALSRLIKTVDPENGATHPTEYAYDARDNLTSVEDPRGLVTQYQYNGFNEVIQQTSPDTGVTVYAYDAAGNRTAQTDARGVTVIYHYDALNRLTQIQYTDPSENVYFDYDQGAYGIGRLRRITDATGATEYAYDARGNIVQAVYHRVINGQPQSYTVSYQYDAADRLTRLTYASGRTVDYTRDSAGRVTTVSTTWHGNTATLAESIDYLPFGPVAQLTYGNGLVETRAYDPDYRVSEINVGSTTLEYGYDPNGNIEYIETLPTVTDSQVFDYDALNRLTEATGPYGLRDYVYDPVGNRLSETDDIPQTEAYTYDLDSNQLSQRGSVQYQYDAIGNTIDNGQYTFTYNQANRLSSVKESGMPVADYGYNALGQRVIKQTPAGDILYIYDHNGQLIAELDSAGNTHTEYAYLDGRPLAQCAMAEIMLDPEDLHFTSADTPSAEAHFLLSSRTLQLTQPDNTQTTVTIDPSDWDDDGGNPFRTITFSGRDSSGVQLSGALFYWNGAPTLHVDRIQPPLRKGDYNLELTASDAYSGVDASSGKLATVTILDMAARTLEIAEQDYPTEIYVVPANRWITQDLGFFQSITYTIEEGDLTIQGGFLINPFMRFSWLQTREGLQQADSYDLAVVMPTQTETYYYHTDHLGTPKVLTNQFQQIVWRAEYEPFGKANALIEQIANNLRFPGQYFDSETGFHYNYFRDYDPAIGRYIESDPIGLDGGLNTYSYTQNNPISFSDPQGLKRVPCPEGMPKSAVCDDGKDNQNEPARCVTAECAAGLPPAKFDMRSIEEIDCSQCLFTCNLASLGFPSPLPTTVMKTVFFIEIGAITTGLCGLVCQEKCSKCN